MDDVEERSQAIDLMKVRGRELPPNRNGNRRHAFPKPNSAKAIHNQLQDAGMLHVQRVSRPRIVHVVALLLGHEAVIGAVIDPLEGKGRAEMIAFGRVVINDVENDFRRDRRNAGS